jgi:hypothetical protein
VVSPVAVAQARALHQLRREASEGGEAVTSHEVVIRFGRSFDIRIRGEFRDTTEITIPFADQESADAALAEVSLSVRAVHDAGGEDYRPVVAGEVVGDPAVPELPENDPETDALMVRLFHGEPDAQFAEDLANAVGAERERAAIPAPEPDQPLAVFNEPSVADPESGDRPVPDLSHHPPLVHVHSPSASVRARGYASGL